MQINKINGLIAAPFTPFCKDGSVNLMVIKAYSEKLKKDGVKGVFVCGTTGEGMFMTLDERKNVASEWMKYQTENFKIIVHVGTTSAIQSKELAKHAQEIGAYAFGCMGPVFLQPGRLEELVGFCTEVASGAPDLPFYYYHIPSVTGINLSMSGFIELAKTKIPNLAGIKFTDNNLMEFQKCINLDNGKWDILHGYDELLLAGLAFGAKGAVGSTYNFMAPLYNGIIEDFKNRDIEAARKKQAQSVDIIDVLLKNSGALVAGKTLMKSFGVDCGPCRFPLKTLSKVESEKLINEIKEIGFFANDLM